MAKRFTDTNKYKKPFIRGLQGAYKLLWDFIYHDCDHAGIWIVDFDIAQIYVGSDMPVNKADALKYFNNNKSRIIEVDNKERWFIPSFIDFQYGKLNPENRAHFSVIQILDKYKLLNKNKMLISPLEGAKDKEQDKDMVKVKNKAKISNKEIEFAFCLIPYKDQYDPEMLQEFSSYWCEPNKSLTKLRWELEKTWDINLRLQRWAKNYKPKNVDGAQKVIDKYKALSDENKRNE